MQGPCPPDSCAACLRPIPDTCKRYVHVFMEGDVVASQVTPYRPTQSEYWVLERGSGESMAGISAVGTMVVVGHSFGARKSANMVLAACYSSQMKLRKLCLTLCECGVYTSTQGCTLYTNKSHHL